MPQTLNPVQRIDGVDVHIQGRGAQAIVMVHGWPDTHRLWDGQVAHLQSSCRCIRFTWPGFDDQKPRRAHSLDELVALLKRIVEQTCPGEQVILMAHDWGCLFGYQFAMRHPELVSRIIGVDIGDAGSRAHRQVMTLKPLAMVFSYQAWLALAWVMDRTIDRLFGTALGDRMTRNMAAKMRCPSDPQHIHAGMCYPYFIQWTGAHGGYRRGLAFKPLCPMLFIYGRRKPFQFHSQAFVDALNAKAGSRALKFDTGHWVMTARPADFNQALSDWLGSSVH